MNGIGSILPSTAEMYDGKKLIFISPAARILPLSSNNGTIDTRKTINSFDIFPESAVTIDCTIESIKLLLKIKITEFIIHYIFLKCNYYYIKLM